MEVFLGNWITRMLKALEQVELWGLSIGFARPLSDKSYRDVSDFDNKSWCLYIYF